VPFKANSQPGEAGSLWEKMYYSYNLHREEFLQHYHQRSNAESTFRMVKAKFRDHVRSRSSTAMVNEVLCKFLCHNICVIHQAHIELGLEPVFRLHPSSAGDGPVSGKRAERGAQEAGGSKGRREGATSSRVPGQV
jgi:hypothetical protein